MYTKQQMELNPFNVLTSPGIIITPHRYVIYDFRPIVHYLSHLRMIMPVLICIYTGCMLKGLAKPITPSFYHINLLNLLNMNSCTIM